MTTAVIFLILTGLNHRMPIVTCFALDAVVFRCRKQANRRQYRECTLLPAPSAWTQPEWADAPWLIFIGITALGAHYCMTRAMMLADVTVILPIDFLRLPFISAIAWFTYAEALDPFVLLGAAVIFGGNYYSVRKEALA